MWVRERPGEHPWLGNLPQLLHLYAARREHDASLRRGLAAYLRAELGAAAEEGLPTVLARKAWRRCTRGASTLAR
jgi:hypothetical protein